MNYCTGGDMEENSPDITTAKPLTFADMLLCWHNLDSDTRRHLSNIYPFLHEFGFYQQHHDPFIHTPIEKDLIFPSPELTELADVPFHSATTFTDVQLPLIEQDLQTHDVLPDNFPQPHLSTCHESMPALLPNADLSYEMNVNAGLQTQLHRNEIPGGISLCDLYTHIPMDDFLPSNAESGALHTEIVST